MPEVIDVDVDVDVGDQYIPTFLEWLEARETEEKIIRFSIIYDERESIWSLHFGNYF